MRLTPVEMIRPFEFDWWSGTTESYEACLVYRVDDPPQGSSGGEIAVALGWRPSFGRNRRRVLVFRRPKRVLIELVGTDDFSESRTVAWILKAPGSNRNIARIEDVPAEYRDFGLAPCTDWVTGPSARGGYAVRVHEDDHEMMIRLALIRERHRQQEPERLPFFGIRLASEAAPVAAPSGPLPVVARSVLERLASYSKDYLDEHLFVSIGQFAGARVGSAEEAFAALVSPLASLSMLLGYYAFARQGAERAGYNLACVSILGPYLTQGDARRFWIDFPEWEAFHRAFVSDCDSRGILQNEKFNPGLLRDLYTLASWLPDRGLFNVWAERIRDAQSVRQVFSELMGVHGIKEKIASFICRDVVFLAGLEGVIPTPERSYLQPVDVWIGRVAQFLNPDLTFGKDKASTISRYLAQACTQAGVSGIAFNQGGWYFGSQVAGTADRLIRLLEELDNQPRPRTRPAHHRGRLREDTFADYVKRFAVLSGNKPDYPILERTQ